MFCMYCGTKVPDEARFCMQCGKPIPALAEGNNTTVNSSEAEESIIDYEEEEPIVEEIIEEDYAYEEEIVPVFKFQSGCVPKDASDYDNSNATTEEDNYIVPSEKRVFELSNVNIDELINSSINFMNTSTNGYYCLYCSDYVNYADVRRNGRGECPSCGCHAVGTKADTMADGWGLRLVNSLLYGTQDPYKEIKDYYKSDYFKATGYKFETIVMDKGLCGEYMLDMELAKVKAKRPGRPVHTFYNVIVPEPNGSFQEIDALVFYSGYVFCFEVKNRSGRYQFQHFTDKDWTLVSGSGSSTTVHNPLLQNEEHITALMNYYEVERNKNQKCHYAMDRERVFNMVPLGVKGFFNASTNIDDYDRIVLSEYFGIYFGPDLYQYIEEFFAMIDSQGFEDRFACAKIEVLGNILYQSQQEKDLYKRNRMADKRDKGKFDYKYYYVGIDKFWLTQHGSVPFEDGYLVRTNGIYVQSMHREHPGDDAQWTIDTLHFKYENGKLSYNFKGEPRIYDLKNMPIEILRAKECVVKKVPYTPTR